MPHRNSAAPRFTLLAGPRLPPALFELDEPPLALYLHGALPAGPRVAIVGTRHPSREAGEYARQLAAHLVLQGVTPISGGALGIDTQAHLGALDHDAQTLVVAPSSWDRPYPVENAALFQQVLACGGGYLSAFAHDVPARNPQFFARNSYLVALSHAVVVVEAPLRSGARNAAMWARRLKRPLFVVPSPPWNPRGLGGIVELKAGARPLYSHRDILECLRQQNLVGVPRSRSNSAMLPPLLRIAQEAFDHALAPAPRAALRAQPSAEEVRARVARQSVLAFDSSGSASDQAASPLGLGTLERRVFEAVAGGAHHPEQVSARTGLDLARVHALLLTLALRRVLVAHPTGTYAVGRPR